MAKKKVISILIIVLLIVGITVNIIAKKGKNNTKSTDIAQNVDSADSNVVSEDDLELRGDKYVSIDIKDIDGNTVKFETEKNKPMIVLFWNTSEEEGIEALKILQGYYDKYKEKVDFSAIVVDNSSKVKQCIEENEITLPILFDSESVVSSENNVTEIPSIMAISKKGEIINKVSDELNDDVIEANLDILAENY